MIIAIIKDNIVIDAAVFNDLELAKEFLENDVWPGADSVVELEDGFGIGDSYVDGEWERAPEPEPPPEPMPDRLDIVEQTLKALAEAVEKLQESVEELYELARR